MPERGRLLLLLVLWGAATAATVATETDGITIPKVAARKLQITGPPTTTLRESSLNMPPSPFADKNMPTAFTSSSSAAHSGKAPKDNGGHLLESHPIDMESDWELDDPDSAEMIPLEDRVYSPFALHDPHLEFPQSTAGAGDSTASGEPSATTEATTSSSKASVEQRLEKSDTMVRSFPVTPPVATKTKSTSSGRSGASCRSRHSLMCRLKSNRAFSRWSSLWSSPTIALPWENDPPNVFLNRRSKNHDPVGIRLNVTQHAMDAMTDLVVDMIFHNDLWDHIFKMSLPNNFRNIPLPRRLGYISIDDLIIERFERPESYRVLITRDGLEVIVCGCKIAASLKLSHKLPLFRWGSITKIHGKVTSIVDFSSYFTPQIVSKDHPRSSEWKKKYAGPPGCRPVKIMHISRRRPGETKADFEQRIELERIQRELKKLTRVAEKRTQQVRRRSQQHNIRKKKQLKSFAVEPTSSSVTEPFVQEVNDLPPRRSLGREDQLQLVPHDPKLVFRNGLHWVMERRGWLSDGVDVLLNKLLRRLLAGFLQDTSVDIIREELPVIVGDFVSLIIGGVADGLDMLLEGTPEELMRRQGDLLHLWHPVITVDDGVLSFALNVSVDLGKERPIAEEEYDLWFRQDPPFQWNHGLDPHVKVDLLSDPPSGPCEESRFASMRWWQRALRPWTWFQSFRKCSPESLATRPQQEAPEEEEEKERKFMRYWFPWLFSKYGVSESSGGDKSAPAVSQEIAPPPPLRAKKPSKILQCVDKACAWLRRRMKRKGKQPVLELDAREEQEKREQAAEQATEKDTESEVESPLRLRKRSAPEIEWDLSWWNTMQNHLDVDLSRVEIAYPAGGE